MTDPEAQREFAMAFVELWERHKRGEITMEELNRRMAERVHPGNARAQEAFCRVVDTLTNGPAGNAIRTAVQNPGVSIPAYNDPEEN